MTHTFEGPIFWVGFTAVILTLLFIDLGMFHKRHREMGSREALAWYAVWVSLAALFNLLVWRWFGRQRALEFLTGYLIEQALSVDNIFVFLVLFQYFAVPRAFQRGVLFWGILGAIVMRVTFILGGAALLHAFHWTIYIMGAFLVFTGLKLFRHDATEVKPEKNILVRLLRRVLPVVPDFQGGRFLVRVGGRTHATLLLVVLVAVEATDVAFAIDSIPAIFAVTDDPFIVFTSNIFAILGLRSLFFLLSGLLGRFHYLQVGLATVLIFVGAKMLASGVYTIPIGTSLAVVAGLIGGSIAASLLRPQAKEVAAPTREESAGGR